MHLKCIEMVGFKSFADRTFLELRPGISGIVGPNGCGKSNIVDALRWCLGEMSARSLRSKQMLDVIFAGASGRAPLNLAEVTLTFDNTHKLLPIEFTEVQVTRKLFRSGESEYYLNRTQCRLKDIKDLLMDTGLHEGYSILAQGEVDFVMHAKPEERRELFEEAAGISKYKARREEALRKLEKLELDLNRLNDLISVVKEQMDALEAAARKAKLFQKTKEELKQLEITDALHKIVSLDDQRKAAQARMEELKAEYEKSTAGLNSAEAQLTHYHILQDAAEKEIYDKNVAILDLDKQINASDMTLRTEKEREKEFEDQAAKLKEKIASLEEESKALEAKSRESRHEIETSEVTLNELKTNFAQAKEAWEAAKGERKSLDESKQKISEVIFQMTGDAAALANEKNSLSSLEIHKKSEAVSLSRETDKVHKESLKLAQELDVMGADLEKIKAEKEGFKSGLQIAKAELEATSEQEGLLRLQIQSLKVAIAHAEAQRKILQKKFEKDPYHKGTQSILNQGFPGLYGVLGVLFKYPAHMTHWVESVLGSKLNVLVFGETQQAQDALNWLKEHDLGRARCLILENVPEAPKPDLSSVPNGSALMSFVQCDPALEKLKLHLLGSAFLSGSTLYDAGMIDGGSEIADPKPEDENNAASFQNEFLTLKSVEEEVASNQELLKKLEGESYVLEANFSHLKSVLAEKERETAKLDVQESHYNDLLIKKKEESGMVLQEITLLEESERNLVKELEGISVKLEVASNKEAILNQSLAEKDQERKSLEEAVGNRLAQEHEREVAAKESEVRLETFNRDHEKIEKSVLELEARLSKCVKDIEASKAETADCEARAESSRKKQAEETIQVQTCQERKDKSSLEVEDLLKAKSEREEKNREFLSDLETGRKRQIEVTEILHQADLDLRSHENEIKNILARMEEAYQVSLEQIEKDFQPQPVELEELMKLKKRVESMANSVNLEAPEQHQALSERFNFLNAQTQDLLKAREDLRTAIQQINATTREQFKETFDKVRDNFRKIYSTLFQGGKADLVFTDESNLLETGVDIVAQPPGKKLQNIALLSGGEKALTAISLLFAFFMVKPSPFCVLDEVDAPWDPANVARFLNLLKEFSQKIQFLVVTHNPRTMEVADILYGVTMQEFGISKILSTRLKKDSPAEAPKKELASA